MAISVGLALQTDPDESSDMATVVIFYIVINNTSFILVTLSKCRKLFIENIFMIFCSNCRGQEQLDCFILHTVPFQFRFLTRPRPNVNGGHGGSSPSSPAWPRAATRRRIEVEWGSGSDQRRRGHIQSRSRGCGDYGDPGWGRDWRTASAWLLATGSRWSASPPWSCSRPSVPEWHVATKYRDLLGNCTSWTLDIDIAQTKILSSCS